MALNKSIETSFGIAAEYWKIDEIKMSPKTDTLITISGYANEASRLAGKSVLETRSFTVPYGEFNKTPAYNVAYAELKKLTEFIDALDI